MNRKGFLWFGPITRVVILLGIAGCVPPIKKAAPPIQATIQQQTEETGTPTIEKNATTNKLQPTNSITPTPQEISANWKTYQNINFGFEFKYPADFKFVSSGPNEAQKALDRGEEISGTVAPSLDTITFTNSLEQDQFHVVIFSIRTGELTPEVSPDGFQLNLSFGSDCDIRWIDSIVEEPALVEGNGIPVLEVQVHRPLATGNLGFTGCYYFKNMAGNPIVFNTSSFEQRSDFLAVFHLIGDKILSSLRLIN